MSEPPSLVNVPSVLNLLDSVLDPALPKDVNSSLDTGTKNHDPPEVTPPKPPPPPLPPPNCGTSAGAWKPPWSPVELLFWSPVEPLFWLPDEPPEPELDELAPALADPEPAEPEPTEPEPAELPAADEPVPDRVTAARLEPGRMAATAPAVTTLAAARVTVAAFSRRRPCSRSATARATSRAAAFWSRLFTLTSLAATAVGAVGEVSQDLLSTARQPGIAEAGGVCLASRSCQY